MNIDVVIEGEEHPRRFRVIRNEGGFLLRHLPNGDDPTAPEEPREIHVDLRSPSPRVYSLLVEGLSYDIHVDEDERDDEQLAVHLLSRIVSLRAADARKRRVAKLGEGPDGVVRITAPMPGRVVKVLAPEGTEVTRGDGIIVLEAMKMENELKAPRDGTVGEISVQEGQGVEGGALLATIE
jgi:biotin carboxyl carrier protein